MMVNLIKWEYFLACFMTGCSLNNEEPYLVRPNLYEYTSVVYEDSITSRTVWLGSWNLKVYNRDRFQRIYYGGVSTVEMKKNVVVEGKFVITNDTLTFHDERIMRINLYGCNSWKDTNSVVSYPIRNINPNAGHNDAFEIYGPIDMWDLPDSLRGLRVFPSYMWLGISDYRDSTGWPIDIRRCGIP